MAAGCLSSRAYNGLPELTVNGHKKNSWISGRVPDYGDGHPDGCLVLQEVKVEMNTTIPGRLSGIVRDLNTGDKMRHADVTLYSNNLQDTTKTFTDENGYFSFPFSNSMESMTVSSIGYRTLVVDLSRLN